MIKKTIYFIIIWVNNHTHAVWLHDTRHNEYRYRLFWLYPFLFSFWNMMSQYLGAIGCAGICLKGTVWKFKSSFSKEIIFWFGDCSCNNCTDTVHLQSKLKDRWGQCHQLPECNFFLSLRTNSSVKRVEQFCLRSNVASLVFAIFWSLFREIHRKGFLDFMKKERTKKIMICLKIMDGIL